MTWYPDLANCDYFGAEVASKLKSVGWLASGNPLATGRTAPELFNKLKEYFRDPWQPVVFMGVHECEFCVYEPDARGGKNLFIPGDGFLYVCPQLILHYMNCHSYQPPEAFIVATMQCPEMRSREYHRLLLNNGGRELIAHFRSKSELATSANASSDTDSSENWELWRQDDGGNKYLVARFGSEDAALAEMKMYEDRGHKQVYWVSRAA